jgi:hypothetical protein
MTDPPDFFQVQAERLATRFRCAICDAPSARPAMVREDGARFAWSDWNTPGDLYWCRDCGKYVCPDHYDLSNGLCSTCMTGRFPR